MKMMLIRRLFYADFAAVSSHYLSMMMMLLFFALLCPLSLLSRLQNFLFSDASTNVFVVSDGCGSTAGLLFLP
jgi:hypothetical protein